MRDTPVVHKCTLHFRNGKSVTGSIRSAERTENCGVIYAGAVDDLPYRIEVADQLMLSILFRSFARELNARYEEEQIGPATPVIEDAPEPEAELVPPQEAYCG